MKKYLAPKWLPLLALLLATVPFGCRSLTAPPPTPPVQHSLPQLKYLLISKFSDVFYVDPDFYPVAREGQEEKNSLKQFPAIKANDAEFSAVLEHLGLPVKAEYTSEEKLRIYREHKKLALAIDMAASEDGYLFTLRVGEGQGERIQGTITVEGNITVLKREPSFNTYPICLAAGTLIDTPGRKVPVEQLRQGMTIWTADGRGRRIEAVVEATVKTQVPPSFEIVRLVLDDGRAVAASPSHPSAEGKLLGDYRVGDTLDGATVVALEHVPYEGEIYDILPSGGAGLYWANGVLLKSTLNAPPLKPR